MFLEYPWQHENLSAAAHPEAGAGVDTSDRLEGALDMTPSFMYYSVAWVWLEFLTIGQEAADEAMAKCLGLAQSVPMPTDAGGTAGASVIAGSVRLGGTLQGKPLADNYQCWVIATGFSCDAYTIRVC